MDSLPRGEFPRQFGQLSRLCGAGLELPALRKLPVLGDKFGAIAGLLVNFVLSGKFVSQAAKRRFGGSAEADTA